MNTEDTMRVPLTGQLRGEKLYKMIQDIPNPRNILEQLTGDCKTITNKQSQSGNIYEKMWIMVILLGYCPDFMRAEWDIYDGDVRTGLLNRVENIQHVIEKLSVFSKGKGGPSDITLRHKITGEWAFFSSKYHSNEDKTAANKYDVEPILAAVTTPKMSPLYKKYAIYLLVDDKAKVSHKIETSHNGVVKENIDGIYDMTDLVSYLGHLSVDIRGVPFSQINARFGNTKVSLNLRFHQKLSVHKIMVQIKKGETNLLVTAKPRSGKTYIVGGVLIEIYRRRGRLNALIITPAPNETLAQFTDDLFRKFRDFMDIRIIEIRSSDEIGLLTFDDSNIIIMSKQLLDKHVKENTIASIKSLEFDIVVCDENHFHGTTGKFGDIMESYSLPNTVRLYLTATFAKPLHEWNITSDNIFPWTMEDEKRCKRRDVNALVEVHGPYVRELLTEDNLERELAIYDNMPDLRMLTSILNSEKYEYINQQIGGTPYGLDFATLFSGNFPNEVDLLFRYITGSNKMVDYQSGDQSIFGRIIRDSVKHNSRTRLNNNDFTTQLWFLPFGINLTICKSSEHVRDRMQKNRILAKYDIQIVNSNAEYKIKDIKAEIRLWEIQAKEAGKAGLILLAGNQLTLGITLPFVDIVFLCNDMMSSDRILQMLYRAMTERIISDETDAINSGDKKFGFVVDLNPFRVLNTMLEYNISKSEMSSEQKIRYIVENNIIDIDEDLFETKVNKTQLLAKLMEIWGSKPQNRLACLLKNLEREVIELEGEDQHVLNTMILSANRDKMVNICIRFDEENAQSMQTGKCVERIEDGEEINNAEAHKEEDEISNISLTKDVLPSIIPFSCLLTMRTNNSDIMEILEIISTSSDMIKVFDDQTLIWWNKKDMLSIIKMMVAKYVKKNSSIYNIAIQIKMSLQCLIDRPVELLEFIDQCLKPKQKEKEENGEVFTPMHLVKEMLDRQDEYYAKINNGISLFSQPHMKWFDPAAGMGNFPVEVYLRLMDGLATVIPDRDTRKRHILEDMLYMSEINKKNVYIIHQIFNMNNEYTLNLYSGDTLKLDPREEWNIGENGFDVILGNPPYNMGGIRCARINTRDAPKKTETVWPKFVSKSFEWLKSDGLLAFITPLSWLKNSHPLHDTMLDRYIVWMKLWDNSQSKTTINADIPISMFILHNTANTAMLPTEIYSVMKRRNLSMRSSVFIDKRHSVPLAHHTVFDKLMKYIESQNIRLEYRTKKVGALGESFVLPNTYTMEDRLVVDTYKLKEGILVKRATELHPDANIRKLIISNKSTFAGAFIDDGRLGITGTHKNYIVGENLEVIQRLMSFKISDVIGQYTKYQQDFLSSEAFNYIPDIRKLGMTDITEDAFYELIGLTEEEMAQFGHIRKTTKKRRIIITA